MMTTSNSNKTENFKDVQYAFTRHMRDPENNPAPVDAGAGMPPQMGMPGMGM